MVFNGNELRFSEEEDVVKAVFLKMHEDIVRSFENLPHPEYVSINVLDQTVEQHMEKNITTEKNYDSFYKTFMPFIDMREKSRKKKVQSILETMKVEEIEDKDKVLRINNPSEIEYVESADKISVHVGHLYTDACKSFQIFSQFRPVYEKKFVKKVQKFIDSERPWTDSEFKDHFISVEAYQDLLKKVPDQLYFPLFEIDTTAVKSFLSSTLSSLNEKLQAKCINFFHEEILAIRTRYEELGDRMTETVTTAQ